MKEVSAVMSDEQWQGPTSGYKNTGSREYFYYNVPPKVGFYQVTEIAKRKQDLIRNKYDEGKLRHITHM